MSFVTLWNCYNPWSRIPMRIQGWYFQHDLVYDSICFAYDFA